MPDVIFDEFRIVFTTASKTPSAKAASGGGAGRFLDLDIPAFLRKGGASGGE